MPFMGTFWHGGLKSTRAGSEKKKTYEQEKNEKIGAGKYSKIIYKSNTSTNKKRADKSVDKIMATRIFITIFFLLFSP